MMNQSTRSKRAYFHCAIDEFTNTTPDAVLGRLTAAHPFVLEPMQRGAWEFSIEQLQKALTSSDGGYILLEYSIPRIGKRTDAILLWKGTVVVLEYKVGSKRFDRSDLDQVTDYALDLKNFHSGCEHLPIVPILVATEAHDTDWRLDWKPDRVADVVRTNGRNLRKILTAIEQLREPDFAASEWLNASYRPTPTIVEAATALYAQHSVAEISRSDSGAHNLTRTSAAIESLIHRARVNSEKILCLVTGVPGSGKTLAGLNVATKQLSADSEEHATFLSGNGPLVAVLTEALTRDEVSRSKARGETTSKADAKRRVVAFIQAVHHFRDDALDSKEPPVEHVVVFDEAQRAWNREQAARFMREKRGRMDFDASEPEFFLSVLDRHPDWCVVVCLVGSGQEIHTGEAGILEWVQSAAERFRHWKVALPELKVAGAVDATRNLEVIKDDALHLRVNLRSFRAERVSEFVSAIIDGDVETAAATAADLSNYPIVLTRRLDAARSWLRQQARGSERYGLLASSGAQRLKAEGVNVKDKINAANWFLNDKGDVRSSYALEDAATEFDVQGLEIDWACVCWDAELRWSGERWELFRFRGSTWDRVSAAERRRNLLNSYRVLLTRARQGMVIFVPEGDDRDATRSKKLYEGTAQVLVQCGVRLIDGYPT